MRGRWISLAFVLALAAPAAADELPSYITAAIDDSGRPAADVARDEARHPAETVAFAGVKPGDRVLEMVPAGGYYTRILSRIVGRGGHVYAFTPTEILKVFPDKADASRAIAADPQYANVSVIIGSVSAMELPPSLDVIWTTQNYHDLHLAKFFPDLDFLSYNRALRAALKPGGIYFIADHAAQAGSGLRDIQLHRIDPAVVKTEVAQAGFVFDGASDLLRNPADPHTAIVFDPAIRGHTDQFMLRFRRPLR